MRLRTPAETSITTASLTTATTRMLGSGVAAVLQGHKMYCYVYSIVYYIIVCMYVTFMYIIMTVRASLCL